MFYQVWSDEIVQFFAQFNMQEVLVEAHQNSPETFKGNNQGKTIDGIWATPDIVPISCGYTEYLDDWDHRILWMDLDEKQTFGHLESRAVPPIACRCVLSQAKSVSRYQSLSSTM